MSKAANNKSYTVIIPAYNEESTIIACLDRIFDAAKAAVGYKLSEVVVCINGCTDNTETVVKQWSKLPVKIIHSEPGYIPAMNTLFEYTRKNHPDSLFIKTDADGQVDANSFTVLFDQLARHDELVIVGGHPIPLKTASKNPYRILLAKTLSIRSRSPQTEITVENTARYHPYSTSDPISELDGREDKMKVYFHGRLWCARSISILPNLPPSVIGDDVFLPGWLLREFGPKSLRLHYGAKVYFHPNYSLRRHWKVYRRIFEDRKIVYSLPGFESYALACPLRLDWSYIFTHCKPHEIPYFLLYATIVWVEKISYVRTRYSLTYWQYESKES